MNVRLPSARAGQVTLSGLVLLAGLSWHSATTSTLDFSADNVYFEPKTHDCTATDAAADSGGLMINWMRP